jgi:fatty-acid desaturase
LVEGVYRDRMDRASFHKQFIQYGIMLYLLVMLVQYMLGVDTYLRLLDMLFVQLLLHIIIIVNTYFLVNGEKYYNENVGAE